jgi:hypothetical protein
MSCHDISFAISEIAFTREAWFDITALLCPLTASVLIITSGRLFDAGLMALPRSCSALVSVAPQG